MSKKNELRPLPADLDTSTVGALEELHSQMLATASDLGYEPPDDCLTEITGEEQGRGIVTRLHAGLTEHRERMPLAPDAGGSDTAGAKKTKKSTQEKMADQKAARLARDAEKQPAAEPAKKEKTVAKTAKKTAGKKPAKKAAKKTAAKKATNGGAGRSVPEGKIEWILPKEQGLGAREGTERHERRELLKKHGGRTVASYVEAGGRVATLNRAIAEKVVRVVKTA